MCLAITASPSPAFSERLVFQSYGATEGLTSSDGSCALQAAAGFVLACSEHGVFSYDGRRFINLGPAQGLDEGGLVDDLMLAADGRVVIRYPDRLFVSDRPITPDNPPSSVHFTAVDPRGSSFYSEDVHKIAPFGDGFAMVVGRRTMRVALPRGRAPFLEALHYSIVEQGRLDDPKAIFSAAGQLWEAFPDGRICSADPGAVRCFDRASGLSADRWWDIVTGPGGTVIARSIDRIAMIDPRSGFVREEMLPHQGEPYRDSSRGLGLFRSPTGELVTQAAGGIIVRKPSGWVYLSVKDGIPAGNITSIFSDASGRLWLLVYGRGLFAGLGYGHWEDLQNEDGLSDVTAWQSVHPRGGAVWVATDGGIDEILQGDGTLRVGRVLPGPGYVLAAGPDGTVWGSSGNSGALRLDPTTGATARFASPPVEAIATGGDRRVWLATDRGLFVVDARSAVPFASPAGPPQQQVVALSLDGDGGVWFLSGGRLWHRHRDGSSVRVGGLWPTTEFVPLSMAVARDRIWVAGPGGVFVLSVDDDAVVSMSAVATSDLGTNSAFAVLHDHRGWIWVGTNQGLSVSNGRRWVSVDSNSGLAGNDVAQGGISEDADGSMWIATSQGLSHLLDPASLFAAHPVRVVISAAMLGDRPLPAGRLPYSTEPLSLQFGTFSYASERSIIFRYHLSGVDDGWAESNSGLARYASIPAGHHVLTLVGYDVLTHTASAPVSLTIDMRFPPWRRWWADTFYVLAVAAAFWGFGKVRERASRAKQRQLEALVEERTAQISLAQAELQRLATLDGLTGLLNRVEAQRRLDDSLSSGSGRRAILIAMVDIDHFKRINDTYGHLVGDDVLQEMGARAASLLRPNEYAGRFGGEEIILVLDDQDRSGARRVLGFHRFVRQIRVPGCDVGVTCSIGLAWAKPDDDWRSLVGRADAALYKAKRSGRDRVVTEDEVATPDAPGAKLSSLLGSSG